MRLIDLVKRSQIILFEGPWQFGLVQNFLKNKMVVYDAHNVEYMLRDGNKYQEESKQIEKSLIDRADLVFTFTKKDKQVFKNLYGVADEKIYFMPHELQFNKTDWNGENSNRIVFIGSLYTINNSALDKISETASRLPQFSFEIIGSVRPTRGLKLKNVVYHGIVNDEEKDEIMKNCFLALNPVTEGSGRNLKMIDYIAHGLPVLSTEVGARGFEDFDISTSIYICEPSQFIERIRELSNNRDLVKKMSENSRNLYNEIIKSEKDLDPDDLLINAYKRMKNGDFGRQ